MINIFLIFSLTLLCTLLFLHISPLFVFASKANKNFSYFFYLIYVIFLFTIYTYNPLFFCATSAIIISNWENSSSANFRIFNFHFFQVFIVVFLFLGHLFSFFMPEFLFFLYSVDSDSLLMTRGMVKVPTNDAHKSELSNVTAIYKEQINLAKQMLLPYFKNIDLDKAHFRQDIFSYSLQKFNENFDKPGFQQTMWFTKNKPDGFNSMVPFYTKFIDFNKMAMEMNQLYQGFIIDLHAAKTSIYHGGLARTWPSIPAGSCDNQDPFVHRLSTAIHRGYSENFYIKYGSYIPFSVQEVQDSLYRYEDPKGTETLISDLYSEQIGKVPSLRHSRIAEFRYALTLLETDPNILNKGIIRDPLKGYDWLIGNVKVDVKQLYFKDTEIREAVNLSTLLSEKIDVLIGKYGFDDKVVAIDLSKCFYQFSKLFNNSPEEMIKFLYSSAKNNPELAGASFEFFIETEDNKRIIYPLRK